MGESPIDRRYSAAFQRGTVQTTDEALVAPAAAPAKAPAVPAAAPGREVAAPTVDETADDLDLDARVRADPAERGPAHRVRLLWTIAFFLIGAGLCAVSFAFYSEFNSLRWANATPISGTDQWVISDGTGYGTRTVDQFEVLFPQYMSQMSIWIGAIGIATIVANLFRIAAGHPRRR